MGDVEYGIVNENRRKIAINNNCGDSVIIVYTDFREFDCERLCHQTPRPRAVAPVIRDHLSRSDFPQVMKRMIPRLVDARRVGGLPFRWRLWYGSHDFTLVGGVSVRGSVLPTLSLVFVFVAIVQRGPVCRGTESPHEYQRRAVRLYR